MERPVGKWICQSFSGKGRIMQTVKLLGIFLVCGCILAASGCGPDVKELKLQNDTQRKRIQELESEVAAASLKMDQMKRQLEAAQARGGIEADSLREKLIALEKDIRDKDALIKSMRQQLMFGGAALPVELSTMLEDFANSEAMVTYDAERGIVKFESDLLFEKGSDNVAGSANQAVVSLCKILNSDKGKEFDVIVAGHTDDMRIGRPETKAKHPTNWHLSAHRAISVLNVMTSNGIAPERVSVRGFGEYRPVAENKPNKKGNPLNRRVEIYIVAKGV